MRKASVIIAFTIAGLLAAAPAFAWGFEAHRLIMARAIDLLPAQLKPFFDHFRAEVVVRVVDPDEWRSVGWEDDPNHFIDFGLPELGPYPFAGLPRDYSQALDKFGRTELKRIGMLPWRAAEMFGHLQRGFGGFARQAPYATNDVALFAAATSHYVQDAHQPLHATNNYDGQLTGNHGIHARLERDLIEKFSSRLTLSPDPPTPIVNVRESAFNTLLDSFTYVDAILKADSASAAGREVYDDEYFQKFFAAVKPILERQLSRSITATAGVIIGAWESAGRPVLKFVDARPPQKVRK
jgi:hypothetical protein